MAPESSIKVFDLPFWSLYYKIVSLRLRAHRDLLAEGLDLLLELLQLVCIGVAIAVTSASAWSIGAAPLAACVARIITAIAPVSLAVVAVTPAIVPLTLAAALAVAAVLVVSVVRVVSILSSLVPASSTGELPAVVIKGGVVVVF